MNTDSTVCRLLKSFKGPYWSQWVFCPMHIALFVGMWQNNSQLLCDKDRLCSIGCWRLMKSSILGDRSSQLELFRMQTQWVYIPWWPRAKIWLKIWSCTWRFVSFYDFYWNEGKFISVKRCNRRRRVIIKLIKWRLYILIQFEFEFIFDL